jgi:hypothetical protein
MSKRVLFCSINVIANNPKFYPLKFYRYIVVRNVDKKFINIIFKGFLKVQQREIFWPGFFSWIYSIWASDFEAKRIFFSFSFSRSYSNFSINPRSSLLPGFKKKILEDFKTNDKIR